MEQLKRLKEELTNKVSSEIYSNFREAPTEEVGDVIDMIKDLAEAIYYCTVTEAMEGNEEKGGKRPMYSAPMEYYDPRTRERFAAKGGYTGSYNSSSNSNSNGNSNNYSMMSLHDPKEGRSGQTRRIYMEGKYAGKDKSSQMRGLEEYMQELSNDLTEMISDASPEEKQLLQQKISTLAAKIK